MAKKTKIKIKFLRDYAPRKKGEVKEFDEKLAEFYLNNGIAELTDTSTNKKGGCTDCNKAQQVARDLAKANADLKKTQEQLKISEAALKKANADLKKATK